MNMLRNFKDVTPSSLHSIFHSFCARPVTIARHVFREVSFVLSPLRSHGEKFNLNTSIAAQPLLTCHETIEFVNETERTTALPDREL